jgi:glycosyltransferase involved in cell wall biosynthesis
MRVACREVMAATPMAKIYNLTDHWYPDKIGGSCLYAYKLHRLLSRHVPTETITLTGEPAACEEGMVVHKVLSKSRFGENRRALRKFAQDADTIWVVHSPWIYLHLFLALGFRGTRHVVGVYHGPWFHEYYLSASASNRNILVRLALTGLRYLSEVFYALRVPRFIFLSDTMYRATSAWLPIARSKVHIIPMWSEKKHWEKPRPRQDQLLLSTFRRLEPRMGLQDLLQGLHRGDVNNYHLIICGDGPFRGELQDLIVRQNLQNTVTLAGWVSEAEKERLIRESDAVVIPSRSLEGFSLLALEALEQGTPVLVTEAVGFYEYVRHLEQDFVRTMDLGAGKLELRQFLEKGTTRRGLDGIRTIFDAETVGQLLRTAIQGIAAG